MDPKAQRTADDGAAPMAAADALRIQVAAVAAQQMALDEQEIRLAERRAALENDREAHQRQIARINGDLAPAQRDILEADKQARAERQRLAVLQDKLKSRLRRHWTAKQQQYLARQRAQLQTAESLEQREHAVRESEGALHKLRLRFNGDAELARLHLKEASARLRQAQFRWKQRRSLERAALRVRAHELETAAQRITQARAQLEHDQLAWRNQRQALDLELEGVNTRVENQRQALNEQQALLRSLNEQIELKQQQLAALPSDDAVADESSATAAPGGRLSSLLADTSGAAPLAVADAQRVVDLDRLADELADQRIQLVEAWERLTAVHDRWHADRTRAAAEIEALGHRLLERDLIVRSREQASVEAEEGLCRRHEELTHLQQQLIAWHAQLRTEENAWESDRARLQAELRGKEHVAEQHLAALSELRQRWAKRRKQEVILLRNERSALGAFRKEIAQLRYDLNQASAAVDEEKRTLAEKALALEQYRDQVLARVTDDPDAERRLERLRRRWLVHNAETIRQASRARAALHKELLELDQRHEALERRAAAVAAAESDLMEKQTTWEQQQLLAETHYARLEHDLQRAHQHRLLAEAQLGALRDEIERIARALLDQPDPPSLCVDQAA